MGRRLLPGLEKYLSDELFGYAMLVAGPQYPHTCSSFEYPARYIISIRENSNASLLFLVLRGRDRAEDISWRVYINGVKVSRVFKPQHFLEIRGDLYYAYVADVSPVVKDANTIEILVKCHAKDTRIESTGLVALLPGETKSRVSAYLGVSRVEGGYSLQVGERGFAIISIVGRGNGGTIAIGGTSKKINNSFEISELLPDNRVSISGPINVYAMVVNVYTGRPPDVSISSILAEQGKFRLTLTNSGDYVASNIELKFLRGAQAVQRLTIKRIGPKESSEIELSSPVARATAIKITYEFSGHTFTRIIQLGQSRTS
ncbi:MAG: hypothetical protein QW780_02820 [Sulfolobales archaeon]